MMRKVIQKVMQKVMQKLIWRYNKRLVSISIIILLLIPNVAIADKGKTGADFLKIGVGAQALGMAGTQVSLSNDVYALYWNPAGLARIRSAQVGFSFNKWFEDIYHGFGGITPGPYKGGNLGLGIVYLGMEDFQGYDESDNQTSMIKAKDVAVIAGYGKHLLKGLDIGIGIKYIQQEIDNQSAETYALDVGMIADISSKYKIGAGIYNIGKGIEFVKEKDKLPLIMRAGISRTDSLFARNYRVGIDGVKEGDENGMSIGLSYQVYKAIELRMGYSDITKEDVESSGISAGLGFKIKNISINYAITDYGEFDYTNVLSMILRFGED